MFEFRRGKPPWFAIFKSEPIEMDADGWYVVSVNGGKETVHYAEKTSQRIVPDGRVREVEIEASTESVILDAFEHYIREAWKHKDILETVPFMERYEFYSPGEDVPELLKAMVRTMDKLRDSFKEARRKTGRRRDRASEEKGMLIVKMKDHEGFSWARIERELKRLKMGMSRGGIRKAYKTTKERAMYGDLLRDRGCP